MSFRLGIKISEAPKQKDPPAEYGRVRPNPTNQNPFSRLENLPILKPAYVTTLMFVRFSKMNSTSSFISINITLSL
jgi:hypothetical protein